MNAGIHDKKESEVRDMGLFTDGFKLLKKASEPLYKTPKSIQETIEIMAVAENGIFEVSKNKYSKCYRFQDINYTTATEDEQIGIFERYCKFLNSLDCNYKITINNKNKNMDELRDKVLIAEKYNIKTTLLCDTNHVLYSDYSEVIVVGAGADAVDYKLISLCHRGDIVVSQDYGVAAMALGKGAYAIHQSGRWYTDENIDRMLMERHLNKKARRSSHKNHIKGPKKRTEEDDERFAQSFEKMILMAKSKEELRNTER